MSSKHLFFFNSASKALILFLFSPQQLHSTAPAAGQMFEQKWLTLHIQKWMHLKAQILVAAFS